MNLTRAISLENRLTEFAIRLLALTVRIVVKAVTLPLEEKGGSEGGHLSLLLLYYIVILMC